MSKKRTVNGSVCPSIGLDLKERWFACLHWILPRRCPTFGAIHQKSNWFTDDRRLSVSIWKKRHVQVNSTVRCIISCCWCLLSLSGGERSVKSAKSTRSPSRDRINKWETERRLCSNCPRISFEEEKDLNWIRIMQTGLLSNKKKSFHVALFLLSLVASPSVIFQQWRERKGRGRERGTEGKREREKSLLSTLQRHPWESLIQTEQNSNELSDEMSARSIAFHAGQVIQWNYNRLVTSDECISPSTERRSIHFLRSTKASETHFWPRSQAISFKIEWMFFSTDRNRYWPELLEKPSADIVSLVDKSHARGKYNCLTVAGLFCFQTRRMELSIISDADGIPRIEERINETEDLP